MATKKKSASDAPAKKAPAKKAPAKKKAAKKKAAKSTELAARRAEEEGPFLALRREMEEWVEDFEQRFENLLGGPLSWERLMPRWPKRLMPKWGAFGPSVDVSETNKAIEISAELPGMTKDDVEVSLREHSIRIKGEKREETEKKKKDYYRSERRYGAFERVVPLPPNLDSGKAKADFKKGVLKITIPKRGGATKKERNVKIAD